MLTLITSTIIFPANATTQQNTQPHSPPEITPERLRVNLTETMPKDFIHINTPETPCARINKPRHKTSSLLVKGQYKQHFCNMIK